MDHIVALFTRWKPNECKASLLASAKRSQMGRNKVMVQQRKIETEVADCLGQGREEKARIKTESLIHLQKLETAYDILETLMELVQTRIQYISECSVCPPDLEVPIATIIYASKRLQIPEFKTAQKQFAAKFGAGFVHTHADNNSGKVAPNLVQVLLISPPTEGEVHDTLICVAAKHNVDWKAPRKLETIAERNVHAQPLAIAEPPVMPKEEPKPFQYNDFGPPPPEDQPDDSQKPEQESQKPPNEPQQPPEEPKGSDLPKDDLKIPSEPVSPVNDPQYTELMDRLRRLKLNDDSKSD